MLVVREPGLDAEGRDVPRFQKGDEVVPDPRDANRSTSKVAWGAP
jgi:hypothetical protein